MPSCFALELIHVSLQRIRSKDSAPKNTARRVKMIIKKVLEESALMFLNIGKERNKMLFFEDLLPLISVTAPTFQWVISALNTFVPPKATHESNGTKKQRWRKRTHSKKKRSE